MSKKYYNLLVEIDLVCLMIDVHYNINCLASVIVLLFDIELKIVVSLVGIYSVELVNDSLYEWHVKIRT